jgi:hypothetical protein
MEIVCMPYIKNMEIEYKKVINLSFHLIIMKIKDMPEQNRSRERLEKYGENEFVRGNITWP